MSVFTVVIIIWIIYQLIVSLIKKGKQQTPGKVQGSWREQIQQASQKNSRQVEEWTVPGESLKSAIPEGFMHDYVQTEGTQGIEGTQGVEGIQGIEGTSAYEGTIKVYQDIEESPDERMPKGAQATSGNCFSIKKKEFVQGFIWAEVLGKPRAFHPFRGPRS